MEHRKEDAILQEPTDVPVPFPSTVDHSGTFQPVAGRMDRLARLKISWMHSRVLRGILPMLRRDIYIFQSDFDPRRQKDEESPFCYNMRLDKAADLPISNKHQSWSSAERTETHSLNPNNRR